MFFSVEFYESLIDLRRQIKTKKFLSISKLKAAPPITNFSAYELVLYLEVGKA